LSQASPERTEEGPQERLWVSDINIGPGVSHVLVNGGENGGRSLACSLDLQEGVIVVFGFFAPLAVVEVLADAALVANADDWGDAAAIALNAWVDFVRVHGFIEDIPWPSDIGVDLVPVIRSEV